MGATGGEVGSIEAGVGWDVDAGRGMDVEVGGKTGVGAGDGDVEQPTKAIRVIGTNIHSDFSLIFCLLW